MAINLNLLTLAKGKKENGNSAEQHESLTGAELALICLYPFLQDLFSR